MLYRKKALFSVSQWMSLDGDVDESMMIGTRMRKTAAQHHDLLACVV
jgi:hypothetical protein